MGIAVQFICAAFFFGGITMSKLYNKYLELKKENANKYYLFESGIFYLFLGEDARRMSPFLLLKQLPFTNDVMKCGFPKNALDKYKKILDDKKIDYQIIGKEELEDEVEPKIKTEKKVTNNKQGIVDFIASLDIYRLSPMDAFEILVELKERCSREQ